MYKTSPLNYHFISNYFCFLFFSQKLLQHIKLWLSTLLFKEKINKMIAKKANSPASYIKHYPISVII